MSIDMPKTREQWVLRLLVVGIWVTLAFLVFTLILYFLPRQVIVLNDFKTEKSLYHVGEPIITTASLKRYTNAYSTYDARMACKQGRYLLGQFDANTTPDPDFVPVRRQVGVIPVIPTPDTCQIIFTANNRVTILPGIERSYVSMYYSNFFEVQAAEVSDTVQ
jgi:hypothetical protein